MKKFNNKGFVLAETLVVTVFVMSIFTLLYVNFFPLLGEYAKREFYDDIDSKYDVYWLKRMIQNSAMLSDTTFNAKTLQVSNNRYAEITCNDFESQYQGMCKEYINMLVATDPNDHSNTDEVNKNKLIRIYLTNYKLGNKQNPELSFKQLVKNDSESDNPRFSTNFHDYVSYLPNYETNASPNGAWYRIIVEFRRKIDVNSNSDDDNLYYTFSTIEINRGDS